MSNNFDFSIVDKILDAHDCKQQAVIAILQEIQEHYRYLPQEVFPHLARFRQELGLSENKKTTDDLGFTVETVSCLGACGLAPVIMVNEEVYPAMTPEKASELIAKLRGEIANA